jgi:hypothetical protein
MSLLTAEAVKVSQLCTGGCTLIHAGTRPVISRSSRYQLGIMFFGRCSFNMDLHQAIRKTEAG